MGRILVYWKACVLLHCGGRRGLDNVCNYYVVQNCTAIKTLCLLFRKVVFDRLAFFPDNAIGLPYGTEFHVVKSNLEVVEESVVDHLESAQDDDTTETKDNRAIFDDQSAQKLTHEEICSMKEKGMKGKVCMYMLSIFLRTMFSETTGSAASLSSF